VLTDIVVSEQISQKGELEGQLLGGDFGRTSGERVTTVFGALDLCRLKNSILSAPLEVDKSWGGG
jgi:hypothetical protein